MTGQSQDSGYREGDDSEPSDGHNGGYVSLGGGICVRLPRLSAPIIYGSHAPQASPDSVNVVNLHGGDVTRQHWLTGVVPQTAKSVMLTSLVIHFQGAKLPSSRGGDGSLLFSCDIRSSGQASTQT